jgi:hypothetical protein
MRTLMRREYAGFRLNSIDWLMILLGVWSVIAYTVLWGTANSFVYRSARTFDMLALYFLFRVHVRSWDEIYTLIKSLSFACLVLAASMLFQFVTQTNPMYALGAPYNVVVSRLGVLRCQAGFGHPISAGVVGGSLIPLFVIAWRMGGDLRKWAILGISAGTIMTVTSASSSTVMAYAAGVGALFMWKYRHRMSAIRWAVFIGMIFMDLLMQAPVWALLARFKVFGGSTGYHRYWLFNEFVNRVNEWWLIGIKSTADWNPLLWDVVNQYVLMGVRAGILGLALFVIILALCFREVGRAVNRVQPGDPHALMVWSFGAMLFSHCVTFWGYDYWDQIIILWYMLLAIIGGLQEIVPEPEFEISEIEQEASGAEGLSAEPMTPRSAL